MKELSISDCRLRICNVALYGFGLANWQLEVGNRQCFYVAA